MKLLIRNVMDKVVSYLGNQFQKSCEARLLCTFPVYAHRISCRGLSRLVRMYLRAL